MAGYADDSAVYLASADRVESLLQVTNTFGAVSGLCLNHDKTMVVALSKTGSTSDTQLPSSLKFEDMEQQGRYLGIYVGSVRDPEKRGR